MIQFRKNQYLIVKNKLFFILMISFICLFTSIPSYSIELFDTYNQIKTTFEGLSRFLDTIYSFISAISNFLGFRAIALFFAIAFTSAGLSAIGFPKGKISFFLSMVIINILWFTWNTSFEIDWIYTIATMLKTNGILLFPYIAFLVIKHYKDTIIKSASKIFHFIFPFLKKEGIQKHSFIELIKSINVLYTGVVNSLINDYFKSDTTIKLSDDSIKTIEQLEKLLQKLKESRGKG